MQLTRPLTAVAVLALACAPAAFAKGKPEDPGSNGKGHSKPAKAKNVVLKGVVVSYDAGSGAVTVTVNKATKFGRSLVGTDAAFIAVKVNVADTNGDGALTTADLVAGDKVVVQARIAKDGVAPYAARRIVDQTHPKASHDDASQTEDAPAS
jgi:hypothetical protein